MSVIQVLHEMREVGKRKRSCQEFEPYIRVSPQPIVISGTFLWLISAVHLFSNQDFAPLSLGVPKDWIKRGNHSEFMQSSFREYHWREALLLGLAMLSQGLALMNSNIILKWMGKLSDPKDRSHINSWKLLPLIWNINLIPIAIKPHTIFFLCSEQNFKAGCFEWHLFYIAKSKELMVSMPFHVPWATLTFWEVLGQRHQKSVSCHMYAGNRRGLVKVVYLPWYKGYLELEPEVTEASEGNQTCLKLGNHILTCT